MMQMSNSKTMDIVDEGNGTMQRVCELPNGLYRVEFYERYTSVKGWQFIFSDGDYTKECLEEELGIVLKSPYGSASTGKPLARTSLQNPPRFAPLLIPLPLARKPSRVLSCPTIAMAAASRAVCGTRAVFVCWRPC